MWEIHPDEHYGKWTTIEKDTRPDRPDKKRGHWLCRCECGTEKYVRSASLYYGTSKSCGNCSRPKPHDKIGKWELLYSEVHKTESGASATFWFCRCECGTEKFVSQHSLVDGTSKSCGCNVGESTRQRHTTHGMSKSPIYKSYHCMMDRCYNPKHDSYSRYGGRANNPITVCDRWHDVFQFLEDAKQLPGYQEDMAGLTLDRIDNDGPYSPDNCRWADSDTQGSNRSDNVYVDYNGGKMTLAQIARIEGVSYPRLYRFYQSRHAKQDIHTIIDAVKAKERQTTTLAQIARDNNVPYDKLYHQHVTRQLPLEQAIEKAKQLTLC